MPRRRRHSGLRLLATIASVATLAVTGVLGVVTAIVNNAFDPGTGGEIVHVVPTPSPSSSSTPAQPGNYTATNILVMGTDTRTGQGSGFGSAADSSGNGHSDTTLLVHVPASRKWAEVISIPRDTTYHMPKCAKSAHTIDRFNVAFAGGGAICTIQLVESVTGLRIDHYVVVKFSGFQRVVNDLGGIPVCATRNLADPIVKTSSGTHGSGLYLKKGTTILNGDQALKLMRARYAFGDGSDLSRIDRQQIVLGAIVRKTVSAGTLSSPTKALNVLNAISKSVTLDPGLAKLQNSINFALTLGGVTPANVQFVRMPTLNNNDGATIRMSTEAKRMWATIGDDKPWPALPKPKPKPTASATSTPTGPPLKTPPSHVSVVVYNGSGVTGAATSLGNNLHTTDGFVFLGAKDWKTSDVTKTYIRYDPRWDQSARTLAAALGGVKTVPIKGLNGTLQVVLGTDAPKVVKVSVSASATPTPTTTVGTTVTTAGKVKCISGR